MASFFSVCVFLVTVATLVAFSFVILAALAFFCFAVSFLLLLEEPGLALRLALPLDLVSPALRPQPP